MKGRRKLAKRVRLDEGVITVVLDWSGGQQTRQKGDGSDVHPSIPCGGDLHITVASGDDAWAELRGPNLSWGFVQRAVDSQNKQRAKEDS